MSTVDDINRRTLKMLDARQYVEAMKDAIDIVRGEEMSFPPQPDRMRSGHLNTWVREVGRLPVLSFLKAVSTKQGTFTIARKKIRPGKTLQASEKMLEKWKQAPVVIAVNGDYLVGVCANKASYSGYVQGTMQPDFHKQTGWLTTVEAFEKHRVRVLNQFTKRATKILNG